MEARRPTSEAFMRITCTFGFYDHLSFAPTEHLGLFYTLKPTREFNSGFYIPENFNFNGN